ncbi:MAG: hypothetical protein IJ594_08485, partial [Oscillospiraceae bacterium]|nr:hypothetical protein [Oscillospiraceae bacterium]
EKEASFLSESDERSARLNRLVIEEECRTYILDKAGELDLVLAEVQVDAVWSMEGFWVPYAASLTYRGEEKERSRMEERITADLGIPPERQRWQKDG